MQALKEHGIRVMTIFPSVVDTDLARYGCISGLQPYCMSKLKICVMNAFHTCAMLTTIRQTFNTHSLVQVVLREVPAMYEQLWQVI